MPDINVFVIPILKNYLVYAPLHKFLALVNEEALHSIRKSLLFPQTPPHESIANLVDYLHQVSAEQPTAKTGAVTSPLFLGIVPTRGCNMACCYCDFAAPKTESPQMTVAVARAAVKAYFGLLKQNGQRHGEIQFFGGEPFFAERIVSFVVGYARWLAAQEKINIRFEATTNGLYNSRRCHWIADHFDAIVLSLDGPDDIQTLHRPAINGRSVSDIIIRNAKIFSENNCELVIRACVTQDTVSRLPEIAQWIGEQFLPVSVCFESMNPSPLSDAARMSPPDPWLFAQQFAIASSNLAEANIEAVLSTADINRTQVTFCPVGKDALIALPDGAINACYLLEETWRTAGINMRLGQLDQASFQFQLDQAAIEQARSCHVDNKPACAHCFCRYHCAGGCHVNHPMNHMPGQFDALCIQTRLVTIFHLLQRLGQEAIIQSFFGERAAMETAVFQANDKMYGMEVV